MKFSPKSFEKDHMARTEDGKPLARIVLRSDEDLGERLGGDLEVALVNVPKVFSEGVKGLRFWLNEYEYEIPVDVPSSKIRNRGDSTRVSNFILRSV